MNDGFLHSIFVSSDFQFIYLKENLSWKHLLTTDLDFLSPNSGCLFKMRKRVAGQELFLFTVLHL